MGYLTIFSESKPSVNYRFPPAAQDAAGMAQAITQFCFPEAEQWTKDPSLVREKRKQPKYVSRVPFLACCPARTPINCQSASFLRCAGGYEGAHNNQ